MLGYRRAAMACTDDISDERVCTLDIEASGFGRHGYPIEVGFVHADGRSFCTLIQPAPLWTHWDPSAEQVHGITRATLERHGKPVRVVARLLNEALAGCVAYSDAWGHDYPWLARLYDEAGLAPAFRLESAARLLDDSSLPELARLQREALAAMGLARHRASNDARALQQALWVLRGDLLQSASRV